MIRTYTPSQIADAMLAGEFVRDTEFVLASEVERLQSALDTAIRERDEARAEVARMKARPAEAEIGRLDASWQILVREREEARAEVARMKKLHPPLEDFPWPTRGEAKP